MADGFIGLRSECRHRTCRMHHMSTLITGDGLIAPEGRVRAHQIAGPRTSRSSHAQRAAEDRIHALTVVKGDIGNFSHVLDAVRSSRAEVIYRRLHALLALGTGSAGSPSTQTPWGTFHIFEPLAMDVKKVMSRSSIATFGLGLPQGPIDDLDFSASPVSLRGVQALRRHGHVLPAGNRGSTIGVSRYPSIVGVGRGRFLRPTASWVIENAAKATPLPSGIAGDTHLDPLLQGCRAGERRPGPRHRPIGSKDGELPPGRSA